tara:strand:- start:2421 stop:3218 length:798 start_codon:yes stop_codon:yes gene_type:complete
VNAGDRPLSCLLIVGGRWHDMDYARLQLLQLLAERPRIRTRVFEDYPAPEVIEGFDLIVTYTCDIVPDDARVAALRRFLDGGGRWLALHGTNSVIRFMADGAVECPDEAPDFMDMLGSRFVAHPPIERYRVDIADPDHPLVAGIEPFEVTDELYLSRQCAPYDVLLDADYDGRPLGSFASADRTPARHPVMYLRDHGKGGVLYLTLGHCRGHHNMRPLMDLWPSVDRGAWEEPVFFTLLRRAISWAVDAPAHHAGTRETPTLETN